MKLLILAALLIGVSVGPALTFGQAACPAVVAANVEVEMGEFSLADLLARSTCSELLHAASHVGLGRAPLPGTVRVLDGNQIRAWLRNVIAQVDNLSGSANPRVPERVSVRRAGARADCADIVQRISVSLNIHPVFSGSGLQDIARPDASEASPRQTGCGAAHGIPREARFELTRKVWNPALRSWDVFSRCVDPSDCVPFVVRLPGHDSSAEVGEIAAELATKTVAIARPIPSAIPAPLVPSVKLAKARIAPHPGSGLVRPGETVSLLWDQDGIRLVVPAVALDAGGPGESVRARIARGGRVVHAIVVSAGQLRAAS